MSFDGMVHKNILVHILKDIYTDATVGPFLGFKGGTAVYLLYDLPRFSVDLDFDLLDATQESHIFQAIKNILVKYGTLKESREKRFSLFFLLSYENKLDTAYNIKIEINRREFGSRYEVKSYLGIFMKVMVKEDMAAHKMVAMLERIGKANRDIFDVWFFLKNHWQINEAIIYKRTNLAMSQFLNRCIEALEAMSDRGILSGIGELLNAQQKIWAKAKLRADTLFLLKAKLESLRAQE